MFPKRSTALIEMASGVQVEKMQPTWVAGRICVVQRLFVWRHCRTQSFGKLLVAISHRATRFVRESVVMESFGLPGGFGLSHGIAGASAGREFCVRSRLFSAPSSV